MKVHEKKHWNAGVKGGLVQRYIFVDEGTDTGPIIFAEKQLKWNREIPPEVLQRRVMEQAEWRILPRAIDLIAK